jgi:hypothetical protein
MVTKATPAKKPAVKRAPAKKAAPKAVAPAKPIKTQTTMVAQAIDLIKWVDSPFKLVAVIVLTLVLGTAALVWDSRVVILNAITNSSHKSALREVPVLEKVAQGMMKDLEADTVVVHKANLVVNGRTTLLAYGPKGREMSFDGYNSTLFNKDPVRNAAMIAMLNGEVFCSKHEITGKTSEWEKKQGVEFSCWASIPPEIGEFDGYISAGFQKEPSDLTVVKTRMNLAATEMAK